MNWIMKTKSFYSVNFKMKTSYINSYDWQPMSRYVLTCTVHIKLVSFTLRALKIEWRKCTFHLPIKGELCKKQKQRRQYQFSRQVYVWVSYGFVESAQEIRKIYINTSLKVMWCCSCRENQLSKSSRANGDLYCVH